MDTPETARTRPFSPAQHRQERVGSEHGDRLRKRIALYQSLQAAIRRNPQANGLKPLTIHYSFVLLQNCS